MTAGKLDEVGAQSFACDSLRVLGPDKLIIAANHRGTRNRRKFGQRKRQATRVERLGSKTVESSVDCGFVAVCIDNFPSKCRIRPHQSRLCVELKPLLASQIYHARLIKRLIVDASPDLWHSGAQVHEVLNGPTRRNERNYRPAVRVPNRHYLLAAIIEGTADHISPGIKAQ